MGWLWEKLTCSGWILIFMIIKKSLCNGSSQEDIYIHISIIFFFLICCVHPLISSLDFLITNLWSLFFLIRWEAGQLLVSVHEWLWIYTSNHPPFIESGESDVLFEELSRGRIFPHHCLSEPPFEWTQTQQPLTCAADIIPCSSIVN